MLNCLAVGLGGFVGSVCRYLMGLLPLGRDWAFPIRTFAINLFGAFAIGAITALAVKRADLVPRLVLFLKAGVCGGFTTFSSFALETGDLLQGGHPAAALLYAVASLTLGVLAVFAGAALVRCPPWRAIRKNLRFFVNFTCIFLLFLL